MTQTQEGKSTLVTSILTKDTASVREFLIIDSAEAKIQHKDPAFWAKILEKKIQTEETKNIVITDWRYNAEYNHFKSTYDSYFGSASDALHEPNSIITVRIIRPGISILDDTSEHELDNFKTDFTILNDSTIEYLDNQLDKII